MIESAELVVAALAAGATAGMTGAASSAVQDAYSGLKSLALRALRRDLSGNDQTTVDDQLADPVTHRHELLISFSDADLAEHPELLDAAQKVLELIDPTSTAKGKYEVTVTNSTGMQVGDHNSMTINVPK